MRQERKESLLHHFPAVPSVIMQDMKECQPKRNAVNFVVLLTDGHELFARCYHRYSNYGGLIERQRYVFAKDGCCRYGSNDGAAFRIMKTVREPSFYLGMNAHDQSYIVLNADAIGESDMRYSCVDMRSSYLFISYLSLYCKHPNLEYLAKTGYLNVAIEDEYNWYGAAAGIRLNRHINWRSNNLLKMLHLNRTEFKALQGREHLWETFLLWREKYPAYKTEQLILCANVFRCAFGEAESLTDRLGVSPARVARYLDENHVRPHDYHDYILQCTQLQLNLRDTAVAFPHEFMAAHEHLSEIVRIERDREADENFRKLVESRKPLCFAADGLMVCQPESIPDIVREGKELHHCVGGYAKRHANGKLHILFIRAADAPDKPYYTMELATDGRIVQVRGDHNCSMTPEVAAFIEAYKSHIKSIFHEKARKTA